MGMDEIPIVLTYHAQNASAKRRGEAGRGRCAVRGGACNGREQVCLGKFDLPPFSGQL